MNQKRLKFTVVHMEANMFRNQQASPWPPPLLGHHLVQLAPLGPPRPLWGPHLVQQIPPWPPPPLSGPHQVLGQTLVSQGAPCNIH